MRSLLLLFAILFSYASLAHGQSTACQISQDSCDAYLCMENINHCGKRGF